MTPAEAIALTAIEVSLWLLAALAVAALACWWHERRQDRAWTADTERAIVQAVALVDDGNRGTGGDDQ